MSEHLTAMCRHSSELVEHCRECVALLVRVQKAAALYRKAERGSMAERVEHAALLDDTLAAYEERRAV